MMGSTVQLMARDCFSSVLRIVSDMISGDDDDDDNEEQSNTSKEEVFKIQNFRSKKKDHLKES